MVLGKSFVMSQVALLQDVKFAYVRCCLKTVVDLSLSKMDLCVGAASSAVQPTPIASVAGNAELRGNQYFDITALVREVEDIHFLLHHRICHGLQIGSTEKR